MAGTGGLLNRPHAEDAYRKKTSMNVRRVDCRQFDDDFGNPLFHALYEVVGTDIQFWYGRSLDTEELGRPEAILPELDEAASRVEFPAPR